MRCRKITVERKKLSTDYKSGREAIDFGLIQSSIELIFLSSRKKKRLMLCAICSFITHVFCVTILKQFLFGNKKVLIYHQSTHTLTQFSITLCLLRCT